MAQSLPMRVCAKFQSRVKLVQPRVASTLFRTFRLNLVGRAVPWLNMPTDLSGVRMVWQANFSMTSEDFQCAAAP